MMLLLFELICIVVGVIVLLKFTVVKIHLYPSSTLIQVTQGEMHWAHRKEWVRIRVSTSSEQNQFKNFLVCATS